MFDSGVGGTSVFNEVHKLLPRENIIYLADSKNAPYGNRGYDAIIELCKKNTELLLQKHCKLIVVPCNTATTIALDYLRKIYTVPFIGIEPAIKPAALNSKAKTIGIMATKGTLSSKLFNKTSDLFARNIEVIEIIGNGLVERIEAGQHNTKETQVFLTKLLQPMLEKEIDYLVLGCSHYPYLIPLLKKILPAHVRIIDSGKAVAQQVKNILQRENLINSQRESVQTFFSNIKKTEVLNALIQTSASSSVKYLDF
jgi:glutamate racemase